MYSTEDNGDDLIINSVETGVDGDLISNLHPTLINKNHIAVFVGKSKSGKSNLLVNLLSKGKNKDGFRQSYKKVYHDVIIVSPSLKSFKKNIFDDIDEEKQFDVLNRNTLDFIDDFTETNSQLERNTLVIMDDVGSSLRNPSNERELGLQTQKHRHKRCSWWLVVQKYRDLPTSLRANMSAMFLFRPISLKELDAIYEELLPFNKKELIPFINWVFSEKFNFLFIDMSLEKSNQPIYYKNFKKIIFGNGNNETTLV